MEKSATDWNIVDLLTDQDVEKAVADNPDASIELLFSMKLGYI